MNAPTKIQIINGPDGAPADVFIPYDEYMNNRAQDSDLIPHDVINRTVDGATPARAWREHFSLTRAEVAAHLGISRPAYAQQENSEHLRKTSIEKIAVALGIVPAQLDI